MILNNTTIQNAGLRQARTDVNYITCTGSRMECYKLRNTFHVPLINLWAHSTHTHVAQQLHIYTSMYHNHHAFFKIKLSLKMQYKTIFTSKSGLPLQLTKINLKTN